MTARRLKSTPRGVRLPSPEPRSVGDTSKSLSTTPKSTARLGASGSASPSGGRNKPKGRFRSVRKSISKKAMRAKISAIDTNTSTNTNTYNNANGSASASASASTKTRRPSVTRKLNGNGKRTPTTPMSPIRDFLRIGGRHKRAPSQSVMVRLKRLDTLRLNQRIHVKGYGYGSIRFLGCVHFMQGLFVGVELDEPHGKHDGSVHGKRYFTAKNRHGMLVKQNKVELIDIDAQQTTTGSAGEGGASTTAESAAANMASDADTDDRSTNTNDDRREHSDGSGGGGGGAFPANFNFADLRTPSMTMTMTEDEKENQRNHERFLSMRDGSSGGGGGGGGNAHVMITKAEQQRALALETECASLSSERDALRLSVRDLHTEVEEKQEIIEELTLKQQELMAEKRDYEASMDYKIAELEKSLLQIRAEVLTKDNVLRKQMELHENTKKKLRNKSMEYDKYRQSNQDLHNEKLYGDSRKDDLIQNLHLKQQKYHEEMQDYREMIRKLKAEFNQQRNVNVHEWLFDYGDYALNVQGMNH